MELKRGELGFKSIFLFWIPLAATWLMMAVEGPFLAAVIARLADPKYNLAAYGVSFSVAVFIEAPIIMIMGAATALVRDRDSYIKLRNFVNALNVSITLLMVAFVLPPVFSFFVRNLMGLPEDVARLTHIACVIMIPWPGVIGVRRFYQGVLIRSDLTRRVAYGTLVRLTSMAATALVCYLFFPLDGAVVGALSLTVGVTLEAAVSRWMAHYAVKTLLEHQGTQETGILTYGSIAAFYAPLAMTSVLGLSVPPMLAFFMGHSRMALESLAVWPVINSLVFIFRSLGLSYQEVGIALLGEKNEGYIQLRNFAVYLGLAVVAALVLVAFTPLAAVWFHTVSGLSPELTRFSLWPVRILCLVPGMMVFLSFMRAMMMNHRKTKPVTLATAIEVTVVISLMAVLIRRFDLIGAVAAALSMLVGRSLALMYLSFPFSRILRRTGTRRE